MTPLVVKPHAVGCVFASCDFCGGTQQDERGMAFCPLAGQQHYGWILCGRDICEAQLSASLNAYTISKEKVVKEIGEKVKVKRSSGQLQEGWVIVGDAYKVGDTFYIQVKSEEERKGSKVKVEKTVPLEELRSWQRE